MKSFYFWNLRSHGCLPDSTTGILQPSCALVAAESLASARTFLRAAGLSAKGFRLASSTHAALLRDHPAGTVLWTTTSSDEFIVGRSVDDYVRENPTVRTVHAERERPGDGDQRHS